MGASGEQMFRRVSTVECLAAVEMEGLTAHIRRILASKIDVGSSEFGGLAGTTHRH